MALNEANEKVAQLQNAIKRLDFVKKYLNRNASDIKKEIHSCVSRNLESLQNREVALLAQVDEVLSIKEESLHQQQAHLNQAIGILNTEMTMMKEDTAFERQLIGTLEKLNRMELSPGETPHIAFRADHVRLKESILKYGRVDANGLSFAAFEDPDIPSASLPRHLEDYEDVDHHVFNKPVQKINTSKAMSSITVAIPKLSNRMEDWLQKRTPSTKVTGGSLMLPLTKMSSSISSQPAGLKYGKELDKSNVSTPSDACSLNNWLSLIKNHADLEEEHDFEIVDNSSSKETSEDEMLDSNVPDTSDFFSHIEKDLKCWVNTASNGCGDVKDGTDNNFFRHIPQEAEMWLSKATQQLSSLEGTADTDFFKHISSQSSTWLRSRAYIKNQSTQNVNKKDDVEASIKSSSKVDMSRWLAISPTTTQSEDGMTDLKKKFPRDQGKWLQKSLNTGHDTQKNFQLEEVCRANELCSNASECVSQPNCAVFCQQKSSVKNPIDPMLAFKPQILPISQWHASNYEKVEESAPNFTMTLPVSNDCHWLLPPNNSCSAMTSIDTNNKDGKDEVNQWLCETRQSAEEAAPPRVDNPDLESMYSGSSLMDWLMTPASDIYIEHCKEREHDSEKECSEGWSLCSSPSSINDEQLTKDIKIAEDYMKKWIL